MICRVLLLLAAACSLTGEFHFHCCINRRCGRLRVGRNVCHTRHWISTTVAKLVSCHSTPTVHSCPFAWKQDHQNIQRPRSDQSSHFRKIPGHRVIVVVNLSPCECAASSIELNREENLVRFTLGAICNVCCVVWCGGGGGGGGGVCVCVCVCVCVGVGVCVCVCVWCVCVSVWCV